MEKFPAYQNEIKLRGVVDDHPEIRRNQKSGAEVMIVKVKTRGRWCESVHDGEKQRPSWHTVKIVTQSLIDSLRNTLNKGDWVLLNGPVFTDKWKGKDMVTRYTTHVLIDLRASAHFMVTDNPDKQEGAAA